MTKTLKHTIIWTFVVFVGFTILTMKNHAASDGFNSYGFPFVFYDYFSGKCDNCYDKYGFKLLYLFADIGITAGLVFLIVRLKNKVFGIIMGILTSLPLTSCNSHCDCETVDRKARDGEMLYKICRYIVDNKLISKPANPCDFKVREIISDTLKGQPINRVTLTCCYMGDQALIDEYTNEVIGYIPGAK